MRTVKLATLGAFVSLMANAQPVPDAFGTSISELLSFATLGTVTTQRQAAQVTRDGANYLVRLPLKGFATPDDAAVSAVARPLEGGAVDITSMTFPSSGTVAGVDTSRVSYSIGEQAIHGRIDPSFAQPSSFAADLGAIVLRSEQGGQHTQQTFERYVVDGTMSAEAAGQLDFASRGTATNWHLIAHGPNGFDTDSVVRKVAGRFAVQGLDQAQGTRLLAAVRGLMGSGVQGDARPGALRDIVESLSGLLARFSADETLDDIRFSAGSHGSGTLGRLHMDMAGNVADDRLNAGIDVAADAFSMSGLPADAAAFVPHHLDVRTALAGVSRERLLGLLRAAARGNPDQAGVVALLNEPGARVGVESMAFDAGPLRVTGSARVVPLASGHFGADIHISATGVDALIAQLQGKPSMQQALPLVFIAKGMGRTEGGATVWDIAVGDGGVTVNGTPMGQGARTR